MVPVYVGTAGWSIPGQYANDLPQIGTHLERYSQVFSCAEINSSFYRSHRLSTWAKWAASVPSDFRFSVKAPKDITHATSLECSSERLKTFLEEATALSTKLGPILFQLPPKSGFNFKIAENFFRMFRDLYSGPAVFEPRHPTWFTAEANHLLKKFQIARVAADPAPVPQAATPAGWSRFIYYRLHGSPRMYYSRYSESSLQSIVTNLANQREASETWCIFDNTASGAAFGDAQTLRNLLSTTPATSSSV